MTTITDNNLPTCTCSICKNRICLVALWSEMLIKSSTFCTALYIIVMLMPQALCIFTLLRCYAMLANFAHYNIFPSEGFPVGSQSSVAGYSQLPFLPVSQTHELVFLMTTITDKNLPTCTCTCTCSICKNCVCLVALLNNNYLDF